MENGGGCIYLDKEFEGLLDMRKATGLCRYHSHVAGPGLKVLPWSGGMAHTVLQGAMGFGWW